MKYLCIIFLSFSLFGCPKDLNEPDSKIEINNLSSESIVYSINFDQENDTSISSLPFPINIDNANDFTILPNKIGSLQGPFKRYLEEKPNELLTIFIFSSDSIATLPWEEIVVRESKLSVTQYSLGELETLNWTISYP